MIVSLPGYGSRTVVIARGVIPALKRSEGSHGDCDRHARLNGMRSFAPLQRGASCWISWFAMSAIIVAAGKSNLLMLMKTPMFRAGDSAMYDRVP